MGEVGFQQDLSTFLRVISTARHQSISDSLFNRELLYETDEKQGIREDFIQTEHRFFLLLDICHLQRQLDATQFVVEFLARFQLCLRSTTFDTLFSSLFKYAKFILAEKTETFSHNSTQIVCGIHFSLDYFNSRF